MNLFIVDAIAPFFKGYEKDVINWSKIPFDHLEDGNKIDQNKAVRIIENFDIFCQKATQAGYNSITLDDLAHLCIFPFYSTELQSKIKSYRILFSKLFSISQKYKLKIFITTDLIFYNETIEKHIGKNPNKKRQFAADSCRQLFDVFPEVDGIIVRFGESDGKDVKGDFRSRLSIQNPIQARKMIQKLLPVFEGLNKQLIFRTWSVGVGRIGDIIWNPHTFDKVFKGLESDNFIISMKHGQSDFFRYLPLNSLFFRGKHRKLIEFQARREYEGFGEYPSFIGWDYEKLQQKLKGHNLVGISVWTQTGGWSGFKRLTWLDHNAVWNEINAFVTVRMFKNNLSANEAIQQYAQEHMHKAQYHNLVELLKLSDEVIKELLYIEDFASSQLFFRRLKVPPLITVYWWHIVANHYMRKTMKHFVKDKAKSVEQGFNALDKIKRMEQLALQTGLPSEDLRFQYDTFKVIAKVREYYLMPFDPQIIVELEEMKKRYEEIHPETRYRISLDFSKAYLRSAHLALMVKLFFRDQHQYRTFDKIVTNRLLKWFYPILKRLNKKMVPDFAQQAAMGIDSIFK